METAKAKGCKHIARKLHEKSSSVGETSLGTNPFKPYDGEWRARKDNSLYSYFCCCEIDNKTARVIIYLYQIIVQVDKQLKHAMKNLKD